MRFNLAPPSGTPYVNVQDFNLASIYTNGFDLEGSYQIVLDKVHLPGALTVRALATHIINFIANSGIPGTEPVQYAGTNAAGTYGSTPYWKLYGTQSWDFNHLGVDLTERWFSAGVFGHQYVVCQSNCPISTVNNPTINDNTMPGALYIDLGGRYAVTDKLQAFVKIDNLFNKDPAASPQTNTGIDVNPARSTTCSGGRIASASVTTSKRAACEIYASNEVMETQGNDVQRQGYIADRAAAQRIDWLALLRCDWHCRWH